jgi:hypothetical protein
VEMMGEEKIRVTRLDRIEQRALRSGWEIPEGVREQLLLRQMKIALSKESSNRDATAAFKAVLAAEAMAKRHERSQQPIQHEHILLTEEQKVDRRNAELLRRIAERMPDAG